MMNVNEFENEKSDKPYSDDEERLEYTCYGCYLLDRGEGGENQMAHMDFGGCLYDGQYDYLLSEDEYEETICKNLQSSDRSEIIPQLKHCIICKVDLSLDNQNTDMICNMCEKKENREREVKYQNFVVDNYARGFN